MKGNSQEPHEPQTHGRQEHDTNFVHGVGMEYCCRECCENGQRLPGHNCHVRRGTILKCALTSQEHRVREHFKYKGELVYGPHFDVDALWEIARKRRLDLRPEWPRDMSKPLSVEGSKEWQTR